MNSVTDVSEIKRNPWPYISNEKVVDVESTWEILNDDSSDQGSTRHWFKQNYVAWPSGEQTQITYH